MSFDLVIRDGLVFDGTRAPRMIADIGILQGRIVAIGNLDKASDERTIDAAGLHVAPGFIDLHTHYDAQVFWDPYCTLSGWHGVTSVAIGNCGFGFAPTRAENRDRSMRSMTRVEAIPLRSMELGLPWDWETFPEYLSSLERTPKAVNLLPYVPVGPLLTWVMGFEAAKAGKMPTHDEHCQLVALLEEALDAGACGWSAQRLPPTGPAAAQRDFDGTPMPTDVMHDETSLLLAEVLGRRNEGIIQMTLISGDPKADALHFEAIAKVSRRPVLYNVVQARDDRPDVHRKALSWLRRCRERGIRVYGQGQTTDAGFTFTFEEWNLFDDSDAWCEATTGTASERLRKLSDPSRRQGLKNEPSDATTGAMAGIVVLAARSQRYAKYKEWTIAEIGKAEGKDPIDAMLDIAVDEDLKTLFYVSPPNCDSELLREIVDDESVLFGVSDGGAHTKFLTAGRYPTETLTRIVREHGMISLEEAHWRLSSLPAQYAGFRNRGTIQIGAPADVIVYDYENLTIRPSEIAHDLPGGEWRRIQRASGYRSVIVNGVVTIEDDVQTNVAPGKLLRYGSG